MKTNIYLWIAFAFFSFNTLQAQSPNLMSYQAVIWDAGGNLVADKEVNIRLSILQGVLSGPAVFVETHRVRTNANGLASLLIGGGTTVSGKLSEVKWGEYSFFLKTETDPSGGNNFTISGTTQLVSVPYALYSGVAKTSENISTPNPGLPGQVLTIDKDGKMVWSGATFPTVTTNNITSLTATSAGLGGNCLADGGAPITARGIVYGTTPNPTLSNNVVTLGAGVGSFSWTVNGLFANTLYYARAYATNTAGTAFGNQIIFTTLSPNIPSVTTLEISNITSSSAGVGGVVTSDGGANVITRGVVYGTSANPTLSNTVLTLGSGTGSFSGMIPVLTANTTYYIRAFATNSAGTGYGNELSFKTVTAPSLPSITTLPVNAITSSAANSGGNITSDGGSPITARGVVWSTNPNPDISLTTKTLNGTGSGSFSSSLSGLLPNTTYYLRAYATNSTGTVYGNQLIFNTLSSSSSVTDISGNTYNTVQIGNQVWLQENLKVARYQNGDSIPNVRIDRYNLTSGSWLHHLNDPYYDTQFGKKYNWYAAADPRQICPEGWHLPSADEWQILRNFLGDSTGTKLKQNDAIYWVPHWADKPTNASNFSARGAGINEGGYLGEFTHFWTSTPLDNNNVTIRSLWYNSTEFPVGEMRKADYASIRCVKNAACNVMTQEILDIEKSSLRITGKVIPAGQTNANITERGVVYSTLPNPTITSTKVSAANGMGNFQVHLQNLNPGTLYYVRAYAISSETVFYGEEKTVSTLTDTSSTVKDICGNTYKTVKIGNQTWMAENLRTWKYSNGDSIPNVRIDRYNLTSGSWLHHLNDPYYDTQFGKKYNWYAAADPRQICPEGWHLPSADEWQILRNYLGDSPGTKLKQNGVTYWVPHWADYPTNASNFSARGAGSNEGGYLGEFTHFWTSTPLDNNNVIVRSLWYNSKEFPVGEVSKTEYVSIRCVKN